MNTFLIICFSPTLAGIVIMLLTHLADAVIGE